jgi:SAM-dependent methyltransferase
MTHNNGVLMPLPPNSLMARVAGSPDAAAFSASGERTFKEWSRALTVTGKTFHDFQRILDFGCGCGRVLRHLRPALRSMQDLFGADVDKEAIDWVNANCPGVTGVHLNLLPPSPFETASIDLLVNQSVFTHLPEDVQFAWLGELHRIMKSGGILVLSFHGRRSWGYFTKRLASVGSDHPIQHMTDRYNRRGFFYSQGRNEFELALPEYYGSAFHTISYIEDEWFRFFRCIAWLPGFSLDNQDVLVLQKP